jgi:hypothetical protein
MPWLKMTDEFWTNPKLERLSDKAYRLYVRSLGYCAQHLTDGLLDATALRTLGATQRLCDELVTPMRPGEVGCWSTTRAGSGSWRSARSTPRGNRSVEDRPTATP